MFHLSKWADSSRASTMSAFLLADAVYYIRILGFFQKRRVNMNLLVNMKNVSVVVVVFVF